MSTAVTAPPAPAARTGPPAAGDPSEWNPLGLDYRAPIPRPPIRGRVIDWHCHLFALRHADVWFEAADHYGIDDFVTMTPLEEAVHLHARWGDRVKFIAIPQWGDQSPFWRDNWLRRIEAFHNLGSRVVKFHLAPGTMAARGWTMDDERAAPLFQEVVDRGMILMSHIGDPTLWYEKKYTDTAKFGTRDQHYAMWDALLTRYGSRPWVGAHFGGNPEDLPRLQRLLDKHPQLWLDMSATRWILREISRQRDESREFVIRNADRLLWGSDQVSGDDRGFDFLASRFWSHRKLWETAHVGPTNIRDPDCAPDAQPWIRGLALPTDVLQKIYHDNAVRLMATVGVRFGD
jgi:predicted TIM-barrel fold metal-dependent hydrolase